MSSNIPSSPAYGVYLSQFIHYSWACSHDSHFSWSSKGTNNIITSAANFDGCPDLNCLSKCFIVFIMILWTLQVMCGICDDWCFCHVTCFIQWPCNLWLLWHAGRGYSPRASAYNHTSLWGFHIFVWNINFVLVSRTLWCLVIGFSSVWFFCFVSLVQMLHWNHFAFQSLVVKAP